jgi:hypothetical protein
VGRLASSVAFIVGLLLLGSCTSALVDSTPTGAPWIKPNAETTCDDWLKAMEPSQQTEMAAYYLDIYGREPGRALPIDVATFRLAVTDYCESPLDDLVAGLGEEAKLIQIAAGFVYADMAGEPTPSD